MTKTKQLIIGLTGGIGSGKSVVSQWFEQQHIPIIDTDMIAREVVAAGQPALAHIAQAFGEWIYLDNGELNRRALREYIFKHPDARKTLESITHPLIRQSLLTQLANLPPCPYAILVSPLLFESQQHQFVQRVLLVDVDEHIQLLRASQRDMQSVEQIKQIIAAQLPRQQKLALADDVVHNNGDLHELYAQLTILHQRYLTLSTEMQALPETR